jgi:glycosyltransferase involved in cell wall biosynthesis
MAQYNTDAHSQTLTFAVPFVDGLRYLQRTLDSVVRQRSGQWRAVLVDNTRDSAEREAAERLVASYGDKRMRFAGNDEHIGQCANFNRALSLATTDLVAIVHSDDELLPEYADQALALAQRHPAAAALFFPACIIDASSHRRFSLADFVKRFTIPHGRSDVIVAGEAGLRALVRGCFIMAPTVVYRMSQFGDLRWDESLKMSADLELWSRVLLAGKTIVGTRRPVVYAYRRHAASATASFNANLYRFEEESAVYELIAARAAQAGWTSAARVAGAKTIIRLHLLSAILGDALNRRWGAVSSKRRFLATMK